MIDPQKCVITHYPSPILTHSAKPVEKIDDCIRQIADKMVDIMLENKGIGLAGPQAAVPLAIFVISLDSKKETARVYINPAVELSGGLEETEEGCLSLPGLYVKVKRHKTCSITATNLDGNRFTEQAEGLYAKAIQHEWDHLQGILITDRMGIVARIAARRTLREPEQIYKEQKADR